MQKFVGIFDSGVGGLTVLQDLQKVAPSCNFVYVADHAFCPYGTKTPSQIASRAIAVANYLYKLGACEIVVACNTASVFAAEIRKQINLPIFDVISTTSAVIAAQKRYQTAILLATDATVRSGVYQRILHTFNIETSAVACSEFVPLVETSANSLIVRNTVSKCLANVDNFADIVILGCTHFPLLQKEISRFLGNIPIISCSNSVSHFFCAYPHGSGQTVYLTTGESHIANKAASWCGARFTHVDIF